MEAIQDGTIIIISFVIITLLSYPLILSSSVQ